MQIWLQKKYQDIAEYLLSQRQEAGLPPYSYQLSIRAESTQPDRCKTFLQNTRSLLQSCQTAHDNYDVLILGPVNTTMERRAGQHRYFLLLQAEQRKSLHILMRRCLPQLREMESAQKVRWTMEVDPQDLNS